MDPTTRSRYSRAAASGSMFRAKSLGTDGTGVGVVASDTPSTSSRFDAGSVDTSRTRRPASASDTAVAQASEVLPTPPLPVKNMIRVGVNGRADISSILSLACSRRPATGESASFVRDAETVRPTSVASSSRRG